MNTNVYEAHKVESKSKLKYTLLCWILHLVSHFLEVNMEDITGTRGPTCLEKLNGDVCK